MSRPRLLASAALAASVLIAGSGSLAAAAHPESAPPTIPDVPIDQILEVLTPEQISCLVGQAGALMSGDSGAILAAFDACDISLDQLSELLPTGSTAPGDPADAGPAAVGAVLASIGIDASAAECIADAAETATPANDDEALGTLQACGVSLVNVFTGIATLTAAAAALEDAPSPPSPPSLPSSQG